MSMLVISGVMIGYICSAVTDFVVTFADDSNIVNLHNWSLGSFSGMSWGNVKVMAIVVLLTMVIVFFMSKPIGAYQLGEVLCPEYGSEYQAVPHRTDSLIQYSVCLCDSFCRTNFFCWHCSASHCKKPAENSQTAPCDPGLLSGRGSILSFL